MSHSLKIASLNVNGLSNPVRRSRALAKMKKDKFQIIFLQETHMSEQEQFGYPNTFSSSCKSSRKQGVVIIVN